MKKLVFIVFIFIVQLGYGHDIRMAMFEISQNEQGYLLEMSFDKLDLEKSLITAYPSLSESNDREAAIIEYIKGNFQLSINDTCVDFEVEQITYEEEYVRVKATLPVEYKKIHIINVFNTCLIDYNEGHNNIIKSKLNGKTRTFRLSHKRTSTVIDYRNS